MGSSRVSSATCSRGSSELVAKQRAEFETGPVHASATLDELRAALGGPTPETATANETVVSDLAAARRARARWASRARATSGSSSAAATRPRSRPTG